MNTKTLYLRGFTISLQKGTNDTSYRIVYRLLTAVWIMVGLAYVACLITHGSSVYTDLTTRAESKIEEKKGKHKGETEDKDEDKGEVRNL